MDTSTVASARREYRIESAVLSEPGKLGFPDALGIRNLRMSPESGRVDVALLPRSGSIKLVLIETKVATAKDAASKVIGQLLMYYAAALSLGANGLDCLRTFARTEQAMTPGNKSLIALSGGLTPTEAAWRRLCEGDRVRPEEIALSIALDSSPHPALRLTLATLKMYHGLSVSIVITDGRRIQQVLGP
jgi:hypothetical protein